MYKTLVVVLIAVLTYFIATTPLFQGKHNLTDYTSKTRIYSPKMAATSVTRSVVKKVFAGEVAEVRRLRWETIQVLTVS